MLTLPSAACPAGDPGRGAVRLQLLAGGGEGVTRRRQPAGAEEILGRVGAVQVSEPPLTAVVAFCHFRNRDWLR